MLYQGELEGSKLYNQLLATAKDYFLNSVENAPTDSHETRCSGEDTWTLLCHYYTPYVAEILS